MLPRELCLAQPQVQEMGLQTVATGMLMLGLGYQLPVLCAKVLLKNNHVPKTSWGLDLHDFVSDGDGTGRNESSLTRTNQHMFAFSFSRKAGPPLLIGSEDCSDWTGICVQDRIWDCLADLFFSKPEPILVGFYLFPFFNSLSILYICRPFVHIS